MAKQTVPLVAGLIIACFGVQTTPAKALDVEYWCNVVTKGSEALALYETAQTPNKVSRADKELLKALSDTSSTAGWSTRTPDRYPAEAVPFLQRVAQESKVPAPNRLDSLSRAPFEEALRDLATLATQQCSDPILTRYANS